MCSQTAVALTGSQQQLRCAVGHLRLGWPPASIGWPSKRKQHAQWMQQVRQSGCIVMLLSANSILVHLLHAPAIPNTPLRHRVNWDHQLHFGVTCQIQYPHPPFRWAHVRSRHVHMQHGTACTTSALVILHSAPPFPPPTPSATGRPLHSRLLLECMSALTCAEALAKADRLSAMPADRLSTAHCTQTHPAAQQTPQPAPEVRGYCAYTPG